MTPARLTPRVRQGCPHARFPLVIGLVVVAGCAPDEAVAPPPPEAPSDAAPTAAPPQTGVVGCAALRAPALARAAAGGASSAVEVVDAGGRTLALVADADERALHTFDLARLSEVAVTPLAGRPGHVLALPDGRVVVTLRDAAQVVVLEPPASGATSPFEVRCAVPVAAEPWALAATPDRLLVTSGIGAALTSFELADLDGAREVPLAREPRAVLFDAATGTAFVSHAVGGHLSAVGMREERGEPAIIDLRAGRRGSPDDAQTDALADAHPREASQGYALASVDGERLDRRHGALRILAPHTSVDPGAPEGGGATVGYGGGADVLPVAPFTAVIDPARRRSISDDVSLAGGGRGSDCRLPRSAVVAGTALFVACMDLDAVVQLDAEAADPSASEMRRFAVGAGPTAIAATSDGATLVALAELDGALSRIDVVTGAVQTAPLWRRADATRSAVVERGRRLFHTSRDVRLSRGRACATCHPEGRDDGLLWTSPDGPRQTPSLAGRLEGTAPYGWFGEHATLRAHVASTISRLGGTGLEAGSAREDLDALVAYVASLPAPPVAAPPAKTAPPVARGRDVFVAYGCQGCHPGGGADGRRHDVGTGVATERRSAFDTPTLRGVRATAPYFHDGRHASLEAVLSDPASRMFPGTLPAPDKRALIAYLETL